jgi:hypothetical protein
MLALTNVAAVVGCAAGDVFACISSGFGDIYRRLEERRESFGMLEGTKTRGTSENMRLSMLANPGRSNTISVVIYGPSSSGRSY